jgi:hypothetical protein
MPASPQKRRLAASFRGWLAVVSLCEVDDPDAGGARFDDALDLRGEGVKSPLLFLIEAVPVVNAAHTRNDVA